MDDSSPVNVMSFCRRMQSVAKLFRFVELCILLIILSWLSTRLPFAVRISSEYFRRFVVLIFSPTSIFLLGNAIVVTLLAKSGLFSPETSSSIDNAVVDFYNELRSEIPDESIGTPAKDDEIVYQDKQMICVESTEIAIQPKSNDNDEEVLAGEIVFPAVKSENLMRETEEKQKLRRSKAVDDIEEQEDEVLAEEIVKVSYRRSQSENLRRESEEMKTNQKLRRSETDIGRKELVGGEEDGMSNEEFQRTIEDFIARQVRFHREERLAVVLHGQA